MNIFTKINDFISSVNESSEIVKQGSDEHGMIVSAMNGKLRDMKYFISKGADVNAVYLNGVTALMAAAGGGHVSCVKYLLSKKSRC